jgi:large subunit ribosomal protein L15
MKLSDLKDNKGARKTFKALGRGIGSGKGKTCGRGGKGQTARSGVAINGFEGGQMPIHRRLPKRGFNSLNREKIEVINLGSLQKVIADKKLDASSVITKEMLRQAGLIRSEKNTLKLLSKGELKAAITIEVDLFSKAANDAITKLGGKILASA